MNVLHSSSLRHVGVAAWLRFSVGSAMLLAGSSLFSAEPSDVSIEIVPRSSSNPGDFQTGPGVIIAPATPGSGLLIGTSGQAPLIVPAVPDPVPETSVADVSREVAPPPLPEPAEQSASAGALKDWESARRNRDRLVVPAGGTEPVASGDQSVASDEAALVESGASGRAGLVTRDPATLARLYAEIYASIPFNRSDYDRNPSYRHDATMELLLGQLRPTVVAPPATCTCRNRAHVRRYNPPYFYSSSYYHSLSVPWYLWVRD